MVVSKAFRIDIRSTDMLAGTGPVPAILGQFAG